jgi:hypothetical protein
VAIQAPHLGNEAAAVIVVAEVHVRQVALILEDDELPAHIGEDCALLYVTLVLIVHLNWSDIAG